jgi:hypothetical protein
MTQAVKRLVSKHEALSSNPCTTKKKQKKKKKEGIHFELLLLPDKHFGVL